MSKKLNGGGLEQVSLSFQNLSKMAKNTLFGAVWVPRMSMQGSICIATNLGDKQTPLIAV